MLFDEWKLEEALVVEREEGIEEGIEKERKEVAENLSDYGMPPDQISIALKLPIDTVIRYLGGTR